MIDARVLVLPDRAAEFLDENGLIAIPDSAKESPPQGVVIAIGNKVEVVKDGDRVLYTKNAGVRAEFERTEYLILRESDIHCIL
jgi:chaperonin GroES